MEEKEGLNHLPEEILRHIASFLPYQDVVRLSMTCHRMKLILPTFLLGKGPLVNQLGPNDGHWTPEHYFDTPILTSRPQKVTISMKWRDQVKIYERKVIVSLMVKSGFMLRYFLKLNC